MRLIKHKDNTPWVNAKTGEATANQVAEFAAAYQKADASAHMVAVTEGVDWIGACHVRGVMGAPHVNGAVAVWVSDGTFAQCVWRK